MDTLLPAILSRIVSALPVDSRARAACVCRGWRDVLADPTLWTVVDLSDVAAEKKTPAFVHARTSASKDLGRAFGVQLARDMPSLHTLDVCGCGLVDAALFRLLAGLSANTHLRKLEVKLQPYYSSPSEDVKRDFLDPALKALAARSERSAQ